MDIKIKQEYLLKGLKERGFELNDKFQLKEHDDHIITYMKDIKEIQLKAPKYIRDSGNCPYIIISLKLQETYTTITFSIATFYSFFNFISDDIQNIDNYNKNKEKLFKLLNEFNKEHPLCSFYLDDFINIRYVLYNPYNFDAKAFLEVIDILTNDMIQYHHPQLEKLAEKLERL